jgi:hypothetical protein
MGQGARQSIKSGRAFLSVDRLGPKTFAHSGVPVIRSRGSLEDEISGGPEQTKVAERRTSPAREPDVCRSSHNKLVFSSNHPLNSPLAVGGALAEMMMLA